MKQAIQTITLARKSSTRNLLRGLAGIQSPTKTLKALERIELQSGEKELKTAIQIIRANQLFRGNGVSREFSKTFTVGTPKIVLFSAEEVVDRISANQSRVIRLLKLHHDAKKMIYQCDYMNALSTLEEVIKHSGVSCYLLKTLVYLQNRASNTDENLKVRDRIEKIYRAISLENFKQIRDVIREICNVNSDYLNVYKKIFNGETVTQFDHIQRHFVEHISIDPKIHAQRLSSYFLISLIDSFFYIQNTNKYTDIFRSVSCVFDDELLEQYHKLANLNTNLEPFLSELDPGDQCTAFFRESFLSLEQDDIHKYKTIHGTLFSPVESKNVTRSNYERTLLRAYFGEISKLEDLDRENTADINLEKFDSKRSCYIERSNALLLFIEDRDGHISDEGAFVSLMSRTIEIGSICPTQYLEKIRRNAKSDNLRLVATCLLSIKDNTLSTEHELRKVLQDIVIEKFDSKIGPLLEHLYIISPSVTDHLVHICDETFLTKLFHIIDKPNRAIEVRADILEWYGNKTSSDTYLERAKNLRIDVQISKEKGTIDDSRIYVDPLKFTQWIDDNVMSELVLFLHILSDDSPISSVSISWNSVHSGLTFQDQSASLILRCFEEFCNNRIFGIASYLGRRIRHGTFEGTALKEVNDLKQNSRYECLFADNEFVAEFESWLHSYKEMLQEIKNENLHFNSKSKPNGLLYSSLNNSKKLAQANQLYIDVYNSYIESGDQLAISHLIADHCWRIIEEDLLSIRKYLGENKQKSAILSIENLRLVNQYHYEIIEFCREVNSITGDKFRLISDWFKKPSIASPSTELNILIRAVVAETKEQNECFDPVIQVPENSFTIEGGRYHAVYDALYILVVNAAKHGDSNGPIVFQADLAAVNQLCITVESKVCEQSDVITAKMQIEENLASDFSDAHSIDRKSGIRKLKQLEEDTYIRDVRYDFVGKSVLASFNIEMAQ